MLSDRILETLGARGWIKRKNRKALRRLRSILEEDRDRGARATIAGGPRKPASGFRFRIAATPMLESAPDARRLTSRCRRRRRWAVGACGNKRTWSPAARPRASTSTSASLKYQVQISRQLNPADVEDRAYLAASPSPRTRVLEARRGVVRGLHPRAELRRRRDAQAADEFEIEDTHRQTEFEPIELDAGQPARLPARRVGPRRR